MRSFCFTFLSLFALTASAQLSNYEYTRKLDSVSKADYYRITLSPEIIAHCKSGLNDMRIYSITDKDTVEIPYMSEDHGDKTEQAPVSFEIINDVTHLKCCSYVTLKMKKATVINTISLTVAESNFDKILTVEGSNDNREWFTIAEHLRIVGFDNSGTAFRSTSISFHASEYAYFRIKFDDDASTKITVTDASASESKTIKGSYDELSVRDKKQTENKKEKTSDIILDLKNNYRLSYLTLKSNDKNDFYRNVNIYRSGGTYHTPKGDVETWEMINSGVISSTEENSFVLNNEQSGKIRIEIMNYDNQPITLDEIKIYSAKTDLIAKLPAGNDLYLAYGNSSTGAPVYDLIHFKEKIPASLNIVKYGKEELKTALTLTASAEPLLKNKMWLWLIMGVVIVLIGYFALSMIRKEDKE